jgi:putative SOS response-associated peptidase YedK
MCGRFALRIPPKSIQQHYDLPESVELIPRYNIAPSQTVAVIRQLPGKNVRRLDLLRWGLIPPWAKDIKIGYRMINARAETLSQKPSFRTAFKKHRCLIAADGFYEWYHEGKTKHPFFIQLKNGTVFSFAGLWESWNNPDGGVIESCTIITAAANELVRKIHDRMPVILHPGQYADWLNNVTSAESVQRFLVPFPADEMKAYRVGTEVNSPKNDTPDCIQPV